MDFPSFFGLCFAVKTFCFGQTLEKQFSYSNSRAFLFIQLFFPIVSARFSLSLSLSLSSRKFWHRFSIWSLIVSRSCCNYNERTTREWKGREQRRKRIERFFERRLLRCNYETLFPSVITVWNYADTRLLSTQSYKLNYKRGSATNHIFYFLTENPYWRNLSLVKFK